MLHGTANLSGTAGGNQWYRELALNAVAFVWNYLANAVT
jgi:hypothetical protein